ncbi:MAG: hypothetical protein WC608_03450 [Parcubacteria group bacterium]
MSNLFLGILTCAFIVYFYIGTDYAQILMKRAPKEWGVNKPVNHALILTLFWPILWPYWKKRIRMWTEQEEQLDRNNPPRHPME